MINYDDKFFIMLIRENKLHQILIKQDVMSMIKDLLFSMHGNVIHVNDKPICDVAIVQPKNIYGNKIMESIDTKS